MEQRWQNFIDSGFNTLSIALAIAAGIMVVSSISSFFTTIINICKKNKSADI
jgi:zinc transporter ZupT